MIRMFAKRLESVLCLAGSDTVVASLPLPSGSRINDISIDLRAHRTAAIGLNQLTLFAVEGWIIPILDPDAEVSVQTLWDQLVPKDTDVETVDLDTGAADATPFYEPGEPDFSDMLEVGLRPERIYHANQMLTVQRDSFLTFQDNQTPFDVLWLPGATMRIRIRKNFAVQQPAMLMFAFANPSLDDTTGVVTTSPAEAEWGQLKYVGHVLERALLHVFGVTEAGAETPWEEATALLKKHLEPDVFEDSGGTFDAASFRVTAKSMFDHSVEGRLENQSISTGR